MIGESQKCYLCCGNKAPSLSLFPACVKMESLIFVLAPPALALEMKHSEFSSFGWDKIHVQTQPRFDSGL